jgi:dihydroflavonol-4-reductase
MKVMLTGATGHIGSNVARELIAQGHEVVALVREKSSRKGIEGLAMKIVVGDVLDPASLAKACEGADAVIHCAAEFAIWAPDPTTISLPAVQGTENVLRAAATAGVKRVVVTSSAAAVGGSTRPNDLRTENDWFDDATVPYYRAKMEAERTAKRLSAELGLATIILLPTLVLGPNDHRITPSMRPVLDLANGKQPTVDGGMNVVSVRDVARAHVRALERGEPGERYLIAGDNVTVKDLGAMIAAYTGKVPAHMTLPKWAVRVAASVMEAGAALTGKAPGLTRAAVDDVLGKYAWVDGGKGRAAFDLHPMDARSVVEDTLRWFLESGKLEPRIADKVQAALQQSAA